MLDIVGETAADFVAAATFAGARHDFVFRIGEHGIGYYRDGGAARVHSSQQSTAPWVDDGGVRRGMHDRAKKGSFLESWRELAGE